MKSISNGKKVESENEMLQLWPLRKSSADRWVVPEISESKMNASKKDNMAPPQKWCRNTWISPFHCVATTLLHSCVGDSCALSRRQCYTHRVLEFKPFFTHCLWHVSPLKEFRRRSCWFTYNLEMRVFTAPRGRRTVCGEWSLSFLAIFPCKPEGPLPYSSGLIMCWPPPAVNPELTYAHEAQVSQSRPDSPANQVSLKWWRWRGQKRCH